MSPPDWLAVKAVQVRAGRAVGGQPDCLALDDRWAVGVDSGQPSFQWDTRSLQDSLAPRLWTSVLVSYAVSLSLTSICHVSLDTRASVPRCPCWARHLPHDRWTCLPRRPPSGTVGLEHTVTVAPAPEESCLTLDPQSPVGRLKPSEAHPKAWSAFWA